MNHRKRKQAENLKRPKKQKYDRFETDPPNSKCPYCGETGKICSHINSLSRAWGRGACAKMHNNIKRPI
jgi:hypothetical protein